MLALLDQILAILGAMVLLAWAVRGAAGSTHQTLPYPIPYVFREDAVLLAMLVYLVAAMFLSGLMKSISESSDAVLTGLVVNNGSQLCGIAACLALAARRWPSGVRYFVLGETHEEINRGRVMRMETICLLVAAVGVCPLIRDFSAWLILQIDPAFEFESHPTLQALEAGGLSSVKVVALWIGAALIAPVAEELFFRGILQNFLSGAMRKTGMAITLSAAAFAAVHFSQPHAVPALFFLGVLLSAAYVRMGKLIVPIVIHAVFNLKTLVWETLERQWV